jgi:mannose/fructose-specific phosphotransferase system component IIA
MEKILLFTFGKLGSNLSESGSAYTGNQNGSETLRATKTH